MTYNVRSMRDDKAALGRVISSAEPDVVLVQEAPRFLRWRSLCAELARRSGMVVLTGGGRAQGANMILSTLGVDAEHTADVLFSKDRGLHQRGASIAILRYRGERLGMVGTHLDGVDAPRLRHIDELHAAVEAHIPADVPTVIGGDVNAEPGSASWDRLTADRVDAFQVAGAGNGFTNRSATPHRIIDGIFVDPRITVRRSWVVEHADVVAASDHLPVVAELDW
jgi:endonuclease/exonuclease/phosphatase family metal-dependent hydrolase